MRTSITPVHRSFVDDTKNEVTEDCLEKYYLRKKIGPDINRLLEMSCVDVGEVKRVGYMSPTKDDTHLHLVAITEDKIILTSMPCPI